MKEPEREELIKYRISKARSTFREVDILVKNKLWNSAVNRLYYACYYAVIALLLRSEIKAQTHGGVRHMFGLHFVKSGLISKEAGKFYSDLFNRRLTGDYGDFMDYNEEDVLCLIKPADQFLKEIERLLKH